MSRTIRILTTLLLLGLAALPARAQDRLLNEVVSLNGALLFMDARVPGLVIGAVRNGQIAVFGFGETSQGSGKAPDGDTVMRIGSITKAFTGHVMSAMVADGRVKLTDRLQDRLGWPVTVPEKGGKAVRLVDLVTQTSGLPREVDREPSPDDDPFRSLTREAYIKGLQSDPLLFPPGTGALYSNFGFDLLAVALGTAAGKPYETVLKETVLDPLDLKDTTLSLRDGDSRRLMIGHNFDGRPMPTARATPVMAGASSLYSTPNDILRWLAWHLDRASPQGAEIRLINHAAYVSRDGLSPVAGLDDAGPMSAMALGWVVMAPQANRPLILHKSGGLQGMFTYAAFAPARGVGVFVAINQFNVGAFTAMTAVANGLIEQLAPR
jgi:D-alanyl-D-alanine-carboxypeptidase/D-alanyl-D-alanine-endopeptidase